LGGIKLEKVNTIGIGVIGLGGFGQFLVDQWSRMPRVRIAAASDLDPERAESVGEGIRFYASDSELIADPEVHLVSIATPPSSHQEIALRAIAAGKHVLVEKPLALSASDARSIAEAAEQAGVVATVNFMLRYNPLVEAVREMISEGVFGKVRRLDLRNYATQETVPEGHWFWDIESSGGILVEHGVHFFDMADYLLGSKAVEVTGLAVPRKPGMYDRMFATVVYESGAVGTFWHSFTRPVPLETTTFHIALDLGEIDIRCWVPLSVNYWGWVDERGQQMLSRLLPDPAVKIEEFDPMEVRSLDTTYSVTRTIQGVGTVPQPKMEVYGECVRSILRDMICKIDNPEHILRVRPEDGIEAVSIAEQATRSALGDY
jgi:predicted dehydrogenase